MCVWGSLGVFIEFACFLFGFVHYLGCLFRRLELEGIGSASAFVFSKRGLVVAGDDLTRSCTQHYFISINSLSHLLNLIIKRRFNSSTSRYLSTSFPYLGDPSYGSAPETVGVYFHQFRISVPLACRWSPTNSPLAYVCSIVGSC